MGRLVSRQRHCKHSSQDRLVRRSGTGVALQLAFVGTGNGTLVMSGVDGASPDGEVWTITFSDATNFAVSGSTLGAQAAGTVGTPYVSDGGEVSFLVTAGGTPFVNLDEFTFEAATVEGRGPALQKSDQLRFNEDQAHRLASIPSSFGEEAIHEVMCADGDSAQTPGGRSNQHTFEDVVAASIPGDIGLT